MCSPQTETQTKSVPAVFEPLFWHALYTRVNQEKRVAAHLHNLRLECFLPVCRSERRWSDRTVILEAPLFPGYLFVHIPPSRRRAVVQVSNVIRLVGSGGDPVPICDGQVAALRESLRGGRDVKSYPSLAVGQRVRLITGPLAGLAGVLVRKKKALRVVISIEAIMRSFSVEVDAAELEILSSKDSAASARSVDR